VLEPCGTVYSEAMAAGMPVVGEQSPTWDETARPLFGELRAVVA